MPITRELLEAVGRAPHDLAVHSLVADALQEAGDPRGEFIALMLRARRTGCTGAELRRRATKLFAKNHAAWLGPLTAVRPTLGPLELHQLDTGLDLGQTGWWGEHWSLGFPVALTLTRGLDGRLAEANEWLTVRELSRPEPEHADAVPHELAPHVTPNLRFVEPKTFRLVGGQMVDTPEWPPASASTWRRSAARTCSTRRRRGPGTRC